MGRPAYQDNWRAEEELAVPEFLMKAADCSRNVEHVVVILLGTVPNAVMSLTADRFTTSTANVNIHIRARSAALALCYSVTKQPPTPSCLAYHSANKRSRAASNGSQVGVGIPLRCAGYVGRSSGGACIQNTVGVNCVSGLSRSHGAVKAGGFSPTAVR
ncbi:hypothetical protein LSAT2_029520 [Lamellibrachia satsuma]|nr:hypothetical protein LSAT2_029520 [Lamellibrachia satsuma]